MEKGKKSVRARLTIAGARFAGIVTPAAALQGGITAGICQEVFVVTHTQRITGSELAFEATGLGLSCLSFAIAQRSRERQQT